MATKGKTPRPKQTGLKRPPGTLFVHARIIPSLTDPLLANRFHQSGHLRQPKKGHVLQVVKQAGYTSPRFTRDLTQRVGREQLVSKGVGATIPPQSREPLFEHLPNELLSPRRFWGGMTMGEARHIVYFARQLKQAFETAKRQKSNAIELAKEQGVNFLPTLRVVSVVRPLQNYAEIHDETRLKELLDPKRKTILDPEEQAVANFLAKRNKKYPNRSIHLKLKKGLQAYDIPPTIARSQIVLNYLVRSHYRLDDVNFEEQFSHEKHPPLGFLLQAAGFEAPREKNGLWRDRNKPNSPKVPTGQAAKIALNRFAASVSLAVYLMHKKLNGTFTSQIRIGRFASFASSLHAHNVTLSGEVLDLDTCQTNLKPTSRMEQLQLEDAVLVDNLIYQYWLKMRQNLHEAVPYGQPHLDEAKRIAHAIMEAD